MAGSPDYPNHGFSFFEAIVMSISTEDRKRSAIKGAITRRANVYFEKEIRGRSKVRSLPEYICFLLTGVLCALYPFVTDSIVGIETSVDDSTGNILASTTGIVLYDVALVSVGVMLVRVYDGTVDIRDSEKTGFIGYLFIALRLLVARIMSLVAGCILYFIFVFFSIGVLIGSTHTQITYTGWHYSETNAAGKKEKIAALDRKLERLDVKHKRAERLGCQTSGCARKDENADYFSDQMDLVEAERVALMTDAGSSKTGGYVLLLSIFQYFYPDSNMEMVVFWKGAIVGLLCALGTILSVFMFGCAYYAPITYYFCRRRAVRDRHLGDIPEDYVIEDGPTVTLAGASKNLIGQLKKKAAVGIHQKAHEVGSTIKLEKPCTPKEDIGVQNGTPKSIGVQGCTPKTEIGVQKCTPKDIGVQNCTPKSVRLSKDLVPQEDKGVQGDNCTPIGTPKDECTPIGTPIGTPKCTPINEIGVQGCTPITDDIGVQGVRLKEEIGVQDGTPIKGVQAESKKRNTAQSSRAESDAVDLAKRVMVRYPGHAKMPDSGLLGAINAMGKEFNNQKRIRPQKAYRVFEKITGRKYTPS